MLHTVHTDTDFWSAYAWVTLLLACFASSRAPGLHHTTKARAIAISHTTKDYSIVVHYQASHAHAHVHTQLVTHTARTRKGHSTHTNPSSTDMLTLSVTYTHRLHYWHWCFFTLKTWWCWHCICSILRLPVTMAIATEYKYAHSSETTNGLWYNSIKWVCKCLYLQNIWPHLL